MQEQRCHAIARLNVILRASFLPVDTSPRLLLWFDADLPHTPRSKAGQVGITDLATVMVQGNFRGLTVS